MTSRGKNQRDNPSEFKMIRRVKHHVIVENRRALFGGF